MMTVLILGPALFFLLQVQIAGMIDGTPADARSWNTRWVKTLGVQDL